MPTLTIYTTLSGLGIWNAILNGIAMICSQQDLVWGFAILSSMWGLIPTATRVATSGGGAASLLGSGAMTSAAPLFIALALTGSGWQTEVQVESTTTGAVTVVNNVPFIVAAVPAYTSQLSYQAGQATIQAFQMTTTNYDAISATGTGFVNPLKMLLSARGLLSRLDALDSEVNAVIGACLNPNTGINLTGVEKDTLNAGQVGYSNASTSLSIDGTTSYPTALGTLLYQAAQNTTAWVTDLTPTTTAIYNCPDAANQVAQDVSASFNGPLFSKNIQGSVNGNDEQPTTNNYTYANFQNTYNVIAGGVAESSAEALNFLTYETVEDNLDCLKAGSDRATCLSTMNQKNELERNNLQAAANANQSLSMLGQYSQYLIIVITAMSPVMFMVMMFMGVGAWQSMKTLAQIVLFPQLLIWVGAEIINAVIYMQVADFYTSLRQGPGYVLSHAQIATAYQQLSLKIGAASQIMAGMPTLITSLFALSAAKSLAWKAEAVGHDSTSADLAQPGLTNPTPQIRSESPYSLQIQPGGRGVSTAAGAMPFISSDANLVRSAEQESSGLSRQMSLQKMRSEGHSQLESISHALSTAHYTEAGFDSSFGQMLKQDASATKAFQTVTGKTHSVGQSKDTSTISSLTGSAEMHAGSGLPGGSVGVKAQTGVQAGDRKHENQDASIKEDATRSQAYLTLVDKFRSFSQNNRHGTRTSSSLDHLAQSQSQYQKVLQESQTDTASRDQRYSEDNSFVAQNAHIGDARIAWQAVANDEYAKFQAIEGGAFARDTDFSPYMEKAEKQARSSANAQILNNPAGFSAAVRHRAAMLAAGDHSQSEAVHEKAMKYLSDSIVVMATGERMGAIHPENVAPIHSAVENAKPDELSFPHSKDDHQSHHSRPHQPLARPAASPPESQSSANGDAFMTQTNSDTNKKANNLDKEVKKDMESGKQTGGTIARMNKGISNNVVDAVKHPLDWLKRK